MSFNGFLFSQKSSAIAVRHNPTYVSDIFLRSFAATLIDCLKETYQIFRTAIFQDASEDFFISNNLNRFYRSSYGTLLLSLVLLEI